MTNFVLICSPENGSMRTSSETAIYELTGWDDHTTADKPHQYGQGVPTVQVPTLRPPHITALPGLPHAQHEAGRRPVRRFGADRLERVIASVNQAISDQELALALDGIGAYVTDSASPTDEHRNATTWQLGPGRVVELGRNVLRPRVRRQWADAGAHRALQGTPVPEDVERS